MPTSETTQRTNEISNNGLFQVQRDAKEGVWLKLANRIKNLERNVTLSGAYLEELSVRYKKQIEDLQLAVKKSNEALSVASRFRQQERITVNVLYAEVSNLTERVTNLTNYMEAMSVGAVYLHAFLLVLEIFIGFFFIFVCCRRWKNVTEDKTQISKSVATSSTELQAKTGDSDTSFCTDGIVQVGNGLYVHPKRQKDSETDKDTDISSTPSSSPVKRKKRRHSLEDLFAINEEESQGEMYPIANGGVPQLNRRNSMVALSEPPPLTRKQRRRQQRKQVQVAHNSNERIHHTTASILSENRVEEVNRGSITHPTQRIVPVTTVSSHYHTINSPPKDDSTRQLPWKQVTKSGSVDNLSTGTKVYSSQGTRIEGRNHYVQTEQNSRFVVQPVVNVYLNSLVGDPLTTSNKYDLLNNSLHDDPTPLKERSLNYGLEPNCESVNTQNVAPNKHKSKFNPRKKQLFTETYNDHVENGEDVMSVSTGSMVDKFNKHTPTKVKRSKSNSPKRVGQTAKQRVLFKNFNPDNADWIQNH